MKQETRTVEQLAQSLKIKVHEPFAAHLKGGPELVDFEISLLDCYRLAGHACHSITGAFLSTAAAVERIYPDRRCLRGDLRIEFGAELNEHASGPRANVISYITGAWGDTGFQGLKGRFERDRLVTYGHKDLAKRAIRFRSLSTGKAVVTEYAASLVTEKLRHGLDFPDSWRAEICAVLEMPGSAVLAFDEGDSCGCASGADPNGCC